MGNRWWAAPVLAGAAVVLAACGSSTPSSSPAASNPAASSPAASSPAVASSPATSGVMISTRSTGIGTVLTNAQGHTLYWFAADTSTKSNCTGACATYWPPVMGTPHAASGAKLTMGFGTITRSGGQLQATYDGHPLYTYLADSAAGQTSGNGKNLSGALWWAMTPSGAKPAAPASGSSSSSSGSGGGYGY